MLCLIFFLKKAIFPACKECIFSPFFLQNKRGKRNSGMWECVEIKQGRRSELSFTNISWDIPVSNIFKSHISKCFFFLSSLFKFPHLFVDVRDLFIFFRINFFPLDCISGIVQGPWGCFRLRNLSILHPEISLAASKSKERNLRNPVWVCITSPTCIKPKVYPAETGAHLPTNITPR